MALKKKRGIQPALSHYKQFDIPVQEMYKLKLKLRGFSPQENYTDQVTAAFRRS
jgi:hypothetical protein